MLLESLKSAYYKRSSDIRPHVARCCPRVHSVKQDANYDSGQINCPKIWDNQIWRQLTKKHVKPIAEPLQNNHVGNFGRV